MIAEQVLQRSNLIGTQVISRDTNKKLGLISQLWVDIDQREVVALELQQNLIYRTPQFVQLSSIRWVGDVILVNAEDAVEDINVLRGNLIHDEIITETGQVLGKVRDFKFDISSGQIFSLIIGPPVIPWIPTRLIMAFELAVEEVVGSGPERLIVSKGAQERLHQLNIGMLERLGFGHLLWKRLEEAYLEEYLPTTALTATQQQSQRAGYHEEPEPEEFYDEEEVYEDEYTEPKHPKYEYIEEYYAWDNDAWGDEWSDPPEELPPPSPIGRRPWRPQPPNPLSTATFPDPLDPPIP